ADIVVTPDGTVYVFWLQQTGTPPSAIVSFQYAWVTANGTSWSASAGFGDTLNSGDINGKGNLLRASGVSTNDWFWDNAFPRVVFASGRIYLVYADLLVPGST